MLEFRNKYILKSPHSHFCFRMNCGDTGVSIKNSHWDYKAKSVVETKPLSSVIGSSKMKGIFAFRDFKSLEDNEHYWWEEFKKDGKYILLEYDDDALIYTAPFFPPLAVKRYWYEIVLRYANVLGVYDVRTFKDLYYRGWIAEYMLAFKEWKELAFMKQREVDIVPKVGQQENVDEKALRAFIWERSRNKNYYFNVHGLEHWKWIARIGTQLLEVPDQAVMVWFSVLHDCMREKDEKDIGHGMRASKYIDTIRDKYLSRLNDEQIKTLKYAIEIHEDTIRLNEGDETVKCCLDADRLSLIRNGISIDVNRMSSVIGKYLAENPDELLVHFERKVRFD